jgi:hypothetical protein
VPVVTGSLALFLGLFAFLAFELRAGHDPALSNASAPTAHVKRVVVKRIHKRTVVTRLLPARKHHHRHHTAVSHVAAAPAPTASQAPAPTPTPAPAPTPTPAPVQQAPAPTPAPAPAPAPAPVVTRSS